MKRPLFVLAALSLFAPALNAQQGGGPDRLQRQAEKLLQKDADAAKLTDAEDALVVAAIAQKLRASRAYNWTHLFSKKRVTKADVVVYVADSDLDALYARYAKSMKGKKVISESETQGEAPPPEIIARPPSVEFIEVHGEPFHGLFADNAWEVLEGSQDAADLRAQADDALAQAGPSGRIVGLSIRSSASTLRNTGAAAAMSHKQLSEARAAAALKYVLGYLKAQGAVLDQSQVTIDAAGENGDGTSGPADPYGKGAKGNGGAAHKDAAEYDRYKFVDVEFLVEKRLARPAEPEVVQKPGEASSRVVALKIDVQAKKWQKFKRHTKLKVRHRHTPRPHRGKHKPIPCPDFH
jgi:hypothetical protein